jgi:hypothetical protein
MSQNLLSVPEKAAEIILKTGGVIACPVLSSKELINFCYARGLSLNRDRLFRLERLGLFRPLFRVKTPTKDTYPLDIPMKKSEPWFKNGWAWDTTSLKSDYEIPDENDPDQEAYYSTFQIYHLDVVLSSMNLTVHLDGFLEPSGKSIDWNRNGKNWMEYADATLESLVKHEQRRAVALLCKFISDRYYPHTQGDQRTIQVPLGRHGSDFWTHTFAINWDWQDYSRNWKPENAEKLFKLTPETLKQAYNGLAVSQDNCDPISNWYQLTQFISARERLKLKGDALYAEILRSAAHMLRMLYKDLYKDELPHPNEVTGTIIKPIPEQDVRLDTRRYLEFVVNRYKLNPQPKVTLFVEGQSEEAAVSMIFDKYFGAHPGKFSIEIINLEGVDTATGNKKDDRFRAILRLVDYLHHHQTLTFLILDNENYAKKLKNEAKKAKSKHHNKRYITRPEYIKIWQDCFEMDNFSCSEISDALNTLAKGHGNFSRPGVTDCKKSNNAGKALSDLYKKNTGFGLNKVELNKILAATMLIEKKGKKLTNRPIIQTLERVAKLAIRNPLPTMQESWETNQSSKYLAKKR